MDRKATIVWSVVGIIGFFLLLFCAFCSAVMGFVFLTGAPHAFGPSTATAVIFYLFALLLALAAFFLLRRSVRRLRAARQR